MSVCLSLLPVSLQVDVYIYEPSGIASVETPNTLGEHFSGMAKLTSSKDKAHVVFKPSLPQQRKCENCTTSAIDGVFTVKYDVLRDSNAGELHVGTHTDRNTRSNTVFVSLHFVTEM